MADANAKPETTRPDALEIAAKSIGLRPDQVRRAVEEYRVAASAIEIEPEWTAIMHVSGRDMGMHQHVADGTAVTMQVESWKERSEWKQARLYVFDGKPYEQYAEARAAELSAAARPTPYAL